MENQTITTSVDQTKKIAADFAARLRGGEIVCLSGDLGAGKTTFAQGLLEALGAEGPYTSPTFTIVKEYRISNIEFRNKFRIQNSKFKILHIDAYRITSEDLSDLGFADFAGKPDTITIVEWPENVADIIPEDAIRLAFEWIDENERKITITAK